MRIRSVEKTGAVILGGSHGSLAVIRSLGRHGIPVWFLTDGNTLPRFSRYATRFASWPGAGDAEALPFLQDLGAGGGLSGWVLIPGGDAEARFVAEKHAALSRQYTLITGPWERIAPLYDKRLMYAEAARLGIPCPRSYAVSDLLDGLTEGLGFPLVIKPATREDNNPLTRAKAWRISEPRQLVRRLQDAVSLMGRDRIVVQEVVSGRGERQYSYAGLWDRGVPVASLVARRTRQFPVDFSFTSTFVETVEDPGIAADAERLLAAVGYHGLVEAEFKEDERDGQFKILDVNTRVWTWIGLGERAGVDFPYLAWCMAHGLPITAGSARTGVAWTHFSRDMIAAAQEMLRGRLSPPGYLRSLAMPRTSAAFASDDPLPGLLDLPMLVPRLIGRWAPSPCTPSAQPLPKPVFQGERHGVRQTGGR